MSAINLTGVISVAPDGYCGCEGASEGVNFSFDGGAETYPRVLQTNGAIEIVNTEFAPFPLVTELATCSFLYFAVTNASTTARPRLLIGSPPMLQGVGGSFPTGFVGGETFTFEFASFAAGVWTASTTVAVVFTSGAQTAPDCAREINAALALEGLPSLASVVSGQLVIAGSAPGQDERISIQAQNVVLGFPNTLADALGTGTPATTPGVFIAEFAALPGASFWVQGPAWLTILAAGT